MESKLEPINIALIRTCKDWPEASQYAIDFVDHMNADLNLDTRFHTEYAKRIFAVLFYAASVMEQDLRRIRKWMANLSEASKEIDAILRWKKQTEAVEMWMSFISKNSKFKSDVAVVIDLMIDQEVQRTPGYKGLSTKPDLSIFTKDDNTNSANQRQTVEIDFRIATVEDIMQKLSVSRDEAMLIIANFRLDPDVIDEVEEEYDHLLEDIQEGFATLGEVEQDIMEEHMAEMNFSNWRDEEMEKEREDREIEQDIPMNFMIKAQIGARNITCIWSSGRGFDADNDVLLIINDAIASRQLVEKRPGGAVYSASDTDPHAALATAIHACEQIGALITSISSANLPDEDDFVEEPDNIY